MARFSEDVHADGRCVVRTAGDLDLAAVEEFTKVVRASLDRCTAVELDLGEVTFIDSSGLGALVRLRKEADRKDSSLHLIEVSAATNRLLQLTGLTGHFDIRTRQP